MYELNIKQIINVYYREKKHWNRQHSAIRSYDAIVFFTEGAIEYHFLDKTVTAQKGDFLFLPGNIPYKGEQLSDTVAYFVLDFVCFEDDEFVQLAAPMVFSPRNYDRLTSKFFMMTELWNKQQINVQFKLKSFAYAIISEAFELKNTKESTTTIEEISEYILENLGDVSLKVSSLCDRFFISASQLRRKFIKATGMTPNEYIRTLRINKAKKELICTEKTIVQISLECGFTSPYYFARCFSESENTTPTAYRSKHSCL